MINALLISLRPCLSSPEIHGKTLTDMLKLELLDFFLCCEVGNSIIKKVNDTHFTHATSDFSRECNYLHSKDFSDE